MSNAPKNEKKSVSKWKIFWIVLCSVILLFAAAVITIVNMLFSDPVEIPARAVEAKDFYIQGKITQSVYREMRRRSGKLCTMKLNEEVPFRNLQLVYRDGVISGEYPLDTGIRFLDGGVINIRFAAKISKTPQRWSADVKSVYLGKIPFSIKKANQIVNEALAKADMNDVNQVIQDIYADEDSKLVITYYPEKLLPLLIKSLNKR